jgi:hypothetical protein
VSVILSGESAAGDEIPAAKAIQVIEIENLNAFLMQQRPAASGIVMCAEARSGRDTLLSDG